MAQKCVHKGCGKVFTDPEEECVYHPGPPEFHEGQKGWKCCKPRVLTFDEFLSIPPCTTGKHSTVDETTAPASKPIATSDEPRLKPISTSTNTSTSKSTTLPIHSTTSDTASIPPTKPATPDPRLEEDSDDPSDTIQPGLTCKRRSCNATSTSSTSSKDDCTYHPGIPVFHEGSKGWSCCKRRVLEFDEFMKIEGCKTRQGHCFIGKKAKEKQASKSAEEEEILQDVRNDFYQTPNTLIVSFYLKKIDKDRSEVEFTENGVELNLVTSDKKRFQRRVDTYKELVVEKCEKKILGTKLEMVLYKKESGFGWPRLTREGVDTGERIQVGKALRA